MGAHKILSVSVHLSTWLSTSANKQRTRVCSLTHPPPSPVIYTVFILLHRGACQVVPVPKSGIDIGQLEQPPCTRARLFTHRRIKCTFVSNNLRFFFSSLLSLPHQLNKLCGRKLTMHCSRPVRQCASSSAHAVVVLHFILHLLAYTRTTYVRTNICMSRACAQVYMCVIWCVDVGGVH